MPPLRPLVRASALLGLFVASTAALHAQCNPALQSSGGPPDTPQAPSIGQAEYDAAQRILERAQRMIGDEERKTAERLRQQTDAAVSEVDNEHLPEVIQGAREGAQAAQRAQASEKSGAPQAPALQHQLFISSSMPDAERRALLREMLEHVERTGNPRSVVAYLQGPAPGQGLDEAMRMIQAWLEEIGHGTRDQVEYRPLISIDSGRFDRHGIQVAPTWVSVRDGQVIARAEGVGDLDYVLRRSRQERERGGDPRLGRLGSVWPIEELHLVDEYIPQRLETWIAEHGGERAVLEQGKRNYWKHQPLGELTPATEDHEYIMDPSVEVREDIYAPDPRASGKRIQIAAKGDRINPLEALPWRRPLLVFDATRPEQRRWVARWLEQRAESSPDAPRPMLIASNLDAERGWPGYRDLTQAFGNRRVYLLPRLLRERLGLKHTPSVVTGAEQGTKLRVTEHALTGGGNAARSLLEAFVDASSWFLGHAHAQEDGGDASGDGDGEGEEDGTPDPESACHDANVLSRMFDDVCWDCHIPFSMGGVDYGGDAPPGYFAGPICMCSPPLPGFSAGAWLPDRLLEITRTPFCSPTLFGEVLDVTGESGSLPDMDDVDPEDGEGDVSSGSFDFSSWAPGASRQAGARHRSSYSMVLGPGLSAGRQSDTLASYQAHIWAFPVAEMIRVMLNCQPGASSLDLMFMSELDPAWNDPRIAILVAPETYLVGSPLAQAACTLDAMQTTSGSRPQNVLFWCAGSWGSMYPFTGNLNFQSSPVSDSQLLAVRMIALMHRRGQMRDLVGDPCQGQFAPMIPKENYRWEQFQPVPDKDSTHWTGESTVRTGDHRTEPATGEDYIHILWRWTDCCVEM